MCDVVKRYYRDVVGSLLKVFGDRLVSVALFGSRAGGTISLGVTMTS